LECVSSPPDRSTDGIEGAIVRPKIADRERIRQDVFGRLFGGPPPALDPSTDGEPQSVGRFVIQSTLGRGGMGVVYRAYDPHVRRVVALKLLRPELDLGTAGSLGASRLEREAQAMGRLNHPNVVTVHEVGTWNERIFVAMEYVEGVTLRRWLETPHGLTEVLGVFAQAAEGLAAAHRAGIVHRDFKPDNVMVGHDGRVRVMDFGLARAGSDREETPHTVPVVSSEANDPLNLRLTQTGAVLGTPAYMAPEQHRGSPADARSDQFAFCVALYEALFHERPFAGANYTELADDVMEGRRQPVPSRRIPGWLRRLLERGLATAPSERFESIDALLARLDRGPMRRRAAAVLGVGAVVVASLSAAWISLPRDPGCDRTVHALDGTWDEQRRATVEHMFAATPTAYATNAWRSTERLLDAYAERWIQQSSEVCASRSVLGSKPNVLDRKQRCLESRRDELNALVQLLAEGEPGTVLESVQAAATLSDLGACADERRLHPWSTPRHGPEEERLNSARTELVRAKVVGALGRYDDAVESARAVAGIAQELHAPSLLASALLVQGQYEEQAGHPERAEQTLRASIAAAESEAAHEIRAQALIRLIYVVGTNAERFAEAQALAADAAAVLMVLGADPLLQAKLDTNLGVAARRAGQLDFALDRYLAALDGSTRAHGEDHPETARAYNNLGTLLSLMGRLDEAQQHLDRAITIFASVLGPQHPLLASALGAAANNLARQDRSMDAIRYHERSLAIRRANFHDDHPAVARTLYNLGRIHYNLGHYERAMAVLREGRALVVADKADAAELTSWDELLGLVEAAAERGDMPPLLVSSDLALQANSSAARPAP